VRRWRATWLSPPGRKARYPEPCQIVRLIAVRLTVALCRLCGALSALFRSSVAAVASQVLEVRRRSVAFEAADWAFARRLLRRWRYDNDAGHGQTPVTTLRAEEIGSPALLGRVNAADVTVSCRP
jgi:hypothetical protein